MNLRDLIQDMARSLENEREAAVDLWSWLPSHHFAQKWLGDYASRVQPSVAEVMREAASLFAFLRSGEGLDELMSFTLELDDTLPAPTEPEFREALKRYLPPDPPRDPSLE